MSDADAITIPTSAQIRQSFLDFFREKNHTIVPSSSLLPDSPNLLFTNAGMNQFVPIFLGERNADVDAWRGAVKGSKTRAADTQKCIRAGGKHNDLDDVGLDTYHHTFFEMLGNWSFGDYFKKEAIAWAWELVVERWGFPANRLYATVYSPDKNAGDPAEFDQEAHDFWAEKFRASGLDPAVHIVNGNKKDNFWMMGDTGPCGPCSELHVDLTQNGDTRGALVNKGSPECIEIWNLVFIQFNANPDGTFSPLPAKHVDTGMGFERVCSIIQCTKNFTDFGTTISNYETDVFRPIFNEIENLSGKKYASTLPRAGTTAESEQEKTDIAFRVIADHIRTLTFAIADGIAPSNEGRNYVLRRILRRAVRYGRTLGFHEPFFYKLVDVLAHAMGDVFPEIRAKQTQVKETLKHEEESFNRTLDKGIDLFEREAARLLGSARDSRAVSGDSPETSPSDIATSRRDEHAGRVRSARAEGAKYSKRRLPHFERPWAKYIVTFSTHERRILTEAERDLVLECLLFPAQRNHYELYAACVMPNHAHLLFEPQVKEEDSEGKPIFWSLAELLQNIKSVSAHRLNKLRGSGGSVWEKESFDRVIRSDSDLEEKFLYICRNPWDGNVVGPDQDYRWLWTWETSVALGGGEGVSGGSPETARESRALPIAIEPRTAPMISGAFAFRLYDEQGFPIDLTELMARERGLKVDVAGFEKLMEEQRERARQDHQQKKAVITLAESDGLKVEPTRFLGYDFLETEAVVEAVAPGKQPDELNLILDRTACYAEMGGQVGDHGTLYLGESAWPILDTQKKGDVFVHLLGSARDSRAVLGDPPSTSKEDSLLQSGSQVSNVSGESPETARGSRALPEPGMLVRVSVDAARRGAIQRHHTVTHLLHWALHEVVSRDATQKGSFVGADKLTFDFNSAALTPAQARDVEKLVNEKILENATVSWTEIPFSEIKGRADVMQFFGEKYGELVRVVQIGGQPQQLNGYSMELCGGTHTRATGEIGLFKIVSESAIAAGVRRIEAIAGLNAYAFAVNDAERLKALAAKLNAPLGELEKKLESLLAQQKELEKSLKSALQREATRISGELLGRFENVNGIPAIVADLGQMHGEALEFVANALKTRGFKGVAVLGGIIDAPSSHTGAVTIVEIPFLLATVSAEFTSRVQAGKIIQTIAPIIGGKGGGRPDNARGAGKDATKLDEALAKARSLLE